MNKMKEINTYIIEKLRINKNTKTVNPNNLADAILLISGLKDCILREDYNSWKNEIKKWIDSNDYDNITIYINSDDSGLIDYIDNNIKDQDLIDMIVLDDEMYSYLANYFTVSKGISLIDDSSIEAYIKMSKDKKNLKIGSNTENAGSPIFVVGEK